MASVYQRSEKKPLPPNAKIETKNGCRVAAWTSRGKKYQFPLTPCGTQYIWTAPFWSIRYTPHSGPEVREATRYTDRRLAERLLQQRVQEEEDKRHGIHDAEKAAMAKAANRPILEHIEDYVAYVRSQGRTADHVRTVSQRLRRLAEAGRMHGLSTLRLSTAQDAVSSLCTQYDLSDQTRVHLVTTLKSFTNWLVNDGRLAKSPLGMLKAGKVVNRKYERRCLTVEEFDWLLRVTPTRTRSNHRVAGPDRAMVYLLMAVTGLRKRETASLTPDCFSDEGGRLVLRVLARNEKRRRGAQMPIPLSQTQFVREWLADKPPGRPVAPLPGKFNTNHFRKDLAAARHAYLEAAPTPDERRAREQSDFLCRESALGLTLDTHAFRGLYATLCSSTEASLPTLLAASRHSDARVASRYWHAHEKQLTALQDRVGEMLPGSSRLPSQGGGDAPSQCDGQWADRGTSGGSFSPPESHTPQAGLSELPKKPATSENAAPGVLVGRVSPTTGPFLFPRGPGTP